MSKLIFFLLPLLIFCSEFNALDADEISEILLPGKADNYYSNISSEYKFKGEFLIQVEEEYLSSEEKKNERLKELTELKYTITGIYLTCFVTDKLERFFKNMKYGGFSAMVRNHSFEELEKKEVEKGKFKITFQVDVAGPANLLQTLPRATDVDSSDFAFYLTAKKFSNSELKNADRYEIRNFDPTQYSEEQLEKYLLTVKVENQSKNAYPYFNDFFADGVFDITLWQGHDYNEARSDLSESKNFFSILKQKGFKAPVKKFEDLALDSGPFTKKIKANGKAVEVRVYIFHSDMAKENRPLLREKFITQMKLSDVFFYNGHAGPYYGFYLDPDKIAQIDYKEIPALELPEKQQLFIMAGCQTYSQYADMFYKNPKKGPENLDVITTVNFSYGEGADGVLEKLIRTSSGNRHNPVTYYEIIEGLNGEWINEMKGVMYGIHGIDENPRLHPYANQATLGMSCDSSADCGDKTGNACSSFNHEKMCVAMCTDDSGCPEGLKCLQLGKNGTISQKGCAKVN